MRKLFIETYGCQMNVADSEVIASIMKMAGYETCDNLDDADAILLNTCSVRENAENKIYNRLDTLNALRKKGRNLIVGVVGCMAERVKQDLIKSYDVPVCLEVEPPVTETAVRRITFYERNGMFFNDYDYVQPPLSQGQNSLPLKIMSSGKRISKEQFEDIKSTLYKKVYKVK